MPLYEFTCKKCGHRFEELVSLAEMEAGEVSCPSCASKRVEKGFSTFAANTQTTGAGGFSGGGCGSGGFT